MTKIPDELQAACSEAMAMPVCYGQPMHLSNELIADSVIDLRQVLQDDLDGKERPKPTEAQLRAWRIEEIEQEIAQLEYKRDELRKEESK